MFTSGKYEILYTSVPTLLDGSESAVQYIQGADCVIGNKDLKHHINWKDGNIVGTIESFSVEIESNELKLGNIFYSSPYGILKKNRTGIGATTLELKSSRNSIIVVPTRSLAYSKAQEKKVEEGYWKYLYVGGRFDGIDNTIPSIREYLEDTRVVHKKIIVVADSLPRALREVGNDVYLSFFIMLDEIDSYQTDATYRPILEEIIDYYFQFNYTKRCLVSATLNGFSNPLIKEEPVIELTYRVPLPRNLSLINTNNPNLVAIEKIHHLFTSSTDKILIAYNKVTNIKQVIEGLSDECKSESAILCSIANRRKAGEKFGEIINKTLPKRINFITSTYFVGVDIDEQFHLISISNTDNYYTILSIEKLTQIAGRCRHNRGLLSETIIYNTEVYDSTTSPEERIQEAFEFANSIQILLNNIDSISRLYPNLIGGQFLDVKEDIVRKAKAKLSQGAELNIIRKNINGEYVISYFNIDALYEFNKLKQILYSSPEQLKLALEAQGNNVIFDTQNIELSSGQLENNQRVYEEVRAIEDDEIEELIEELLLLSENNNLNDTTLRSLLMGNYSSRGKKFIERVKELYQFIPISELSEKLKNNPNLKEYRGIFNSAIFWALADNHPFKISICSELVPGRRYLRDDLVLIINRILNYHLRLTLSLGPAVNFTNSLCNTTRGNNSLNQTIYTIKEVNPYNPQEFIGEPIRRISYDSPLNNIFKFGRG